MLQKKCRRKGEEKRKAAFIASKRGRKAFSRQPEKTSLPQIDASTTVTFGDCWQPLPGHSSNLNSLIHNAHDGLRITRAIIGSYL
ncbi:CLUMA_CG005237, isoform A [Clunio marinus]|uniref:CLUMA_CG005237, isoform A n=1 Tax=Clunio marinus TaxID=568069 RepID=A0A1J1HU34_9DIPT|nr:CLUMA_CG005237, isoform A [Clunio marinus]